jgi:hypothetical protein
VFAGSLELSDRPVLGNWNISLLVNGQPFSRSFQVAEYVLPKFQVRTPCLFYALSKSSFYSSILVHTNGDMEARKLLVTLIPKRTFRFYEGITQKFLYKF